MIAVAVVPKNVIEDFQYSSELWLSALQMLVISCFICKFHCHVTFLRLGTCHTVVARTQLRYSMHCLFNGVSVTLFSLSMFATLRRVLLFLCSIRLCDKKCLHDQRSRTEYITFSLNHLPMHFEKVRRQVVF